MKNITIAASAAALLAIGLTGPTAAAAPVEIASGGSAFSLNAPGDDWQYEDFGNLHQRGPRAGIQGPGFVSPRPTGPARPGYGPSSEGR
jgi:hypothetical protein